MLTIFRSLRVVKYLLQLPPNSINSTTTTATPDMPEDTTTLSFPAPIKRCIWGSLCGVFGIFSWGISEACSGKCCWTGNHWNHSAI